VIQSALWAVCQCFPPMASPGQSWIYRHHYRLMFSPDRYWNSCCATYFGSGLTSRPLDQTTPLAQVTFFEVYPLLPPICCPYAILSCHSVPLTFKTVGYMAPAPIIIIIIEKTSVYHTVNGNCALFHTSKTAKMINVILLRAPCQNVNVLLSNITFIIFAVFDV